MLHSGVCSHRCLAKLEICLYPLPQAWHLSSSFNRPVSPSEILLATNLRDRYVTDWPLLFVALGIPWLLLLKVVLAVNGFEAC